MSLLKHVEGSLTQGTALDSGLGHSVRTGGRLETGQGYSDCCQATKAERGRGLGRQEGVREATFLLVLVSSVTRTVPGTRQVLKYLSTGLVKKCIFESPQCSKHNHHSKLPQRRYREHPTAHTDHPRGQHYSRGQMRSARKGQSWDSDPGTRRSVFPTLGLPLINPLTRATHSSGGGVRSAVCCGLVLLTECSVCSSGAQQCH